MRIERKKPAPFIPAYMNAGYGYYSEYLASDEWQATKDRIKKKFPKSRYCWVCDTTKQINLHHENYWAIPNEQFMKDVVYLCEEHHLKVHILDSGRRTRLEKEELMQRRLVLRSRYIRSNLRASTLLHFSRRWLYRLFW